MQLFRAVMVLPVLVTGISFAPSHATKISARSLSMERRMSLVPSREPRAEVNTEPVAVQTNFVLQRRERIARVLVTLDRVAAVTLQLKPETASRLEPVVVDLAEQAVDLSSDEALRAAETDASLTKIENTVSRLVHTMNRLIEPEMSL